MIYLTGSESSSNSDVLLGTRLSALPYGGKLVIEAQANLANSTNKYDMTIQLPDGKVPVDNQMLMAGLEADALGGQLDSRYLSRWEFAATQGGHFTISFTETGAAIVTWRIVLLP